jgi:predicted HTH domain antitoxin
MKTVLTTVRLPEKIVKVIEERAREERLDRATILRKFLEEAVKDWKIEEATKLYKDGKISISRAAEIAGLSVGEMMDELVKRGVKSELTVEEYKVSLATAFKLFGIKKK